MTKTRLGLFYVLSIISVFITTPSFAQVPGILNYQGRVAINGTNFTGTGQFKFALVDGTGSKTYWTQDGTAAGEPASSVSVTVGKGLYSVLLGQSPMVAIAPTVFTNTDIRLRVWFDNGAGIQRLTPDQRIAAVGYALMAATVTNGAIDSTKLSTDVLSLAKVSGGAMTATGSGVGIGTVNPQRALHLEREMLIKGNDGSGAEYTDWPYASLSIRRSDDFVDNGVSMLSLGYRNDPIYVTDDSVANIRLYDLQQASNAPTSSATTQLRVASPGPIILQPSGGKVGVGVSAPVEKLDVAGAVRIANTTNPTPAAGTIRWTGTDFQGYNGQQWQSLTAPTPAGMVLVPRGLFTMGSTTVDTGEPEWNPVPEHQVTLSSFYLARYEVTYALWYSVRQWATNNGYFFQNAGREGNRGTTGAVPTTEFAQPVTYVSWRDCIVWCNARSEKESLQPVYTYTNAIIRDSRDANASACDNAVFNRDCNGYRLPTEAEWEYAARYIDGISQTPGDYASGGGFSAGTWQSPNVNVPACDAISWYHGNSSNRTHTVGTRMPNQLGLYDMSGNVIEWCWNWYECYQSGEVTNPVGPLSGQWRVLRGGEAFCVAFGVECALQSATGPTLYNDETGFRCAKSAR